MKAIAVAVAVDLRHFVSSNDSGISSSRATMAIAPPAKPSPAGSIGRNYKQQCKCDDTSRDAQLTVSTNANDGTANIG